jgi:hypothetical protein
MGFNRDQFTWVTPVAVFALIAVIGFFYYQRQNRRRQQKEDDALARGLEFLGEDLPSDLPPTFLDVLPESLNVANCVSGYRRGERVLSFNFGSGKAEPSLTAVAVKRRHPERKIVALQGFGVNQVNDWTLLYTSGLLMAGPYGSRLSREVVEELWETLHTVTAADGDASQRAMRSESGLHIAPRHK